VDKSFENANPSVSDQKVEVQEGFDKKPVDENNDDSNFKPRVVKS
jgi:hypothetical protein